MQKKDLMPLNNTSLGLDEAFGPLAGAVSVLLNPLQKYFVFKSQKEIVLKRMEYGAAERAEILKTISRIASSGYHDEALYNLLMEAYYRTL